MGKEVVSAESRFGVFNRRHWRIQTPLVLSTDPALSDRRRCLESRHEDPSHALCLPPLSSPSSTPSYALLAPSWSSSTLCALSLFRRHCHRLPFFPSPVVAVPRPLLPSSSSTLPAPFRSCRQVDAFRALLSRCRCARKHNLCSTVHLLLK